MARKHAKVTFDDRRGFRATTVRHLNNFVKACVIDACCRAHRGQVMAILDVASGRGQDHAKWVYGAQAAGDGTFIGAYTGIDLSEADTEAAKVMARKFFAPTTKVAVYQLDMATAPWPVEAQAASVVSCQLAVHYLFDVAESLDHFFAHAARCLKPDGLCLLSFADGNSVLRRARNAIPRGYVRAPYYGLDVPEKTCTQRLFPSVFGNSYVFTLPDSVEGIKEYLCHERTVIECAAVHGLRVVSTWAFDELALALHGLPAYRKIAANMGGNGIQDPDALDTANLYRMVVLAKLPDVAKRFLQELRRPPS